MNREALVSPELMGRIEGAFTYLMVALVAIALLLMAINWFLKRRLAAMKARQAQTLGQMLIDEFGGDYRMAWAEVCRIKAEHRLIAALASDAVRSMPAGASATHLPPSRNIH